MKRVARTEDEAIATIPDIRRIGVVGVEPELVIVAFNVEHVEVAVGVSEMYKVPSKPLSFEYSRD